MRLAYSYLGCRQRTVWRRDVGGGALDKETAVRAFEPLFTTRPRGTGLGLAIVRKVVEEHGGSVTLTSALNKGTKVCVLIRTTPTHTKPNKAGEVSV